VGGHIVEAQVAIAVLTGGLLLAVLRAMSVPGSVLLFAQACAVALILAAAAWLLLSGTTSDTEQRIFAVAALLLIGGAADYLSLSALLGGLIAGGFWRAIGGTVQESMLRDALYVQHPLAALVLVMAGAQAEPTFGATGLAVVYVLVRTLASMIGRWLARWVHPGDVRLAVHPAVLPSGVFGVAFALNALRAIGPGMTTVLTVVVLGTIGVEILSRVTRRSEGAA
jgi:hypothetical protein